ncbi:hypothetical protein ES703_72565 [subsurface metagenome]
MVITFDRRLAPGPLDILNWIARYENMIYTCDAAEAEDDHVTAIMQGPVENPGADQVTFSPPPFDVISRRGIPAVAFADFPIT